MRVVLCKLKLELSTMLKVGLTGSIAVGKSFVLGVLAEMGCRILDADATAREVVAPGTPGLKAVIGAFGSEVLREDGALDRAALGAIIFSNEEKRQLLNSILHPFIIAAQDDQIRRWETEDPGGIAVVDAALMIESGGYRRDHLRALTQRVEVDAKEVRIMGAKSVLLRTLVAASGAKTAGFGVPSSVPKWRTRHDSNV